MGEVVLVDCTGSFGALLLDFGGGGRGALFG